LARREFWWPQLMRAREAERLAKEAEQADTN
jgi:hypothetical protein